MTNDKGHYLPALWVGALLAGLAGLAAIPVVGARPSGGLTPQAYLPILVALPTPCDYEFTDAFNDPASGWPVGSVFADAQEIGTTAYVNDAYRIFANEAGAGYLFRPLAPYSGYANYVVEADMWLEAATVDALYGLVFGAIVEGAGAPRYYLFEVEPEAQLFRLIRREGSASTTLADYTFSAAVQPGTAVNHLRVDRQGTDITLAINGVSLGTWTDGAISGNGYTGLALRLRQGPPPPPATSSYFDNYRLCVPAGSGLAAAAFAPVTPFLVYDAFVE